MYSDNLSLLPKEDLKTVAQPRPSVELNSMVVSKKISHDDGDLQYTFIKYGLQIVAIMNAVLIMVPAMDLLQKATYSSYFNEIGEDIHVVVQSTAAVSIVVAAAQIVVSVSTLCEQIQFRTWCIAHLIFAAILTALSSCSISSKLDRTSQGFQLMYFTIVDGVFSLTSSAISLSISSPKKSVIVYV